MSSVRRADVTSASRALCADRTSRACRGRRCFGALADVPFAGEYIFATELTHILLAIGFFGVAPVVAATDQSSVVDGRRAASPDRLDVIELKSPARPADVALGAAPAAR